MEGGARFLYECIVIRFGYSLEIVPDQGIHFINKVVKALTSWFDIKHINVNTCKSSTDGQVEQTNHSLYQILAKYVVTQVHTWYKRIHATLWAYQL